jgi:catechol-2,3-dioxygenase
MARTSDFRGKHKLTGTAERAREGEILVTGRLPSQDPLYRMTLGLDVLERCSAATYVRATGELRLRCARG